MASEKAPYLRSGELLARFESRLLIVDVQEKFVPLLWKPERTITNCRKLIRGSQVFGIPVYATEQYPKGLGATVSPLAELLDAPAQKLRFTCTEALDWGTAAQQTDGRHQVVVAGIESHVCVLQTALDLLAAGFAVFVPADAVTSRSELDWRIALERMASCGATIVTTESVLFEWCEASGTPEFKEISQLVKEQVPS
ncbi:MAG: isochorismatase family protein [Planctomycetaceae bacterium]